MCALGRWAGERGRRIASATLRRARAGLPPASARRRRRRVLGAVRSRLEPRALHPSHKRHPLGHSSPRHPSSPLLRAPRPAPRCALSARRIARGPHRPRAPLARARARAHLSAALRHAIDAVAIAATRGGEIRADCVRARCGAPRRPPLPPPPPCGRRRAPRAADRRGSGSPASTHANTPSPSAAPLARVWGLGSELLARRRHAPRRHLEATSKRREGRPSRSPRAVCACVRVCACVCDTQRREVFINK